MTAQQQANALLRQHQLERILKDLELDIAQVVTAQYNPHPEFVELSQSDLVSLNDIQNAEVVRILGDMEEYFA